MMGSSGPILVLGANGKTGQRVAKRLESQGFAVRRGSRRGEPPFDWAEAATWTAALKDIAAAYITYFPDLMAPGAVDNLRHFADVAARSGVQRLLLLTGRSENNAAEVAAALSDSGTDWGILRASWFAQNFSEDLFVDALRRGSLSLPVDEVAEPFIDVEDIAEVAVALLTGGDLGGRVHELTGPQLLTFAEATAEIARAAGRKIDFHPITTNDFAAGLRADGLPEDFVEIILKVFAVSLDGRNATVTDGVHRLLNRPPRDFVDYARKAAETGVWAAA